MPKTISFRVFIILLLFTILPIGGYLATNGVLTRQSDDGLVVNLAGRQRMLTQKMTKELLIFSEIEDPAEQQTQRLQIEKTVRIFNATLYALQSGGGAPIDLEDSERRECPESSGEVRAQLDIVVGLWDTFNENINSVLNSNGQNNTSMDYIRNNNIALLSEMNTAVFLMQEESEKRVSSLKNVLLFFALIGLLIAVASFLIVKNTIVFPINELVKAADSMSKGDISDQMKITGSDEIIQLSDAFERLRLSMASMVDQEGIESDLDDEFDDL